VIAKTTKVVYHPFCVKNKKNIPAKSTQARSLPRFYEAHGLPWGRSCSKAADEKGKKGFSARFKEEIDLFF